MQHQLDLSRLFIWDIDFVLSSLSSIILELFPSSVLLSLFPLWSGLLILELRFFFESCQTTALFHGTGEGKRKELSACSPHEEGEREQGRERERSSWSPPQ